MLALGSGTALPRTAAGVPAADCFIINCTGTVVDGGSEGWLNFWNQTDTTVEIAVKYLNEQSCDTDGWMVEGWWKVAPGQITAVVPLPQGHNSVFYFYGRGADGTEWAGSNSTYVTDILFTRCKDVAADSTTDTAAYPVEMLRFSVDSSVTTYAYPLTTPTWACDPPPGQACL